MSNINIIGGSIYGVLLSLALRKSKKYQSCKINIFEKTNSILNSWKSIKLANKKINRGFFGIEIPRGKDFINLLGEDFIESNFKKIHNYKLLLINSDFIPYQYEINDLPQKYFSEVNEFITSKENFENKLKNKTNDEFFNLIKECSKRYSDIPSESVHMFYPWFFPKTCFSNNLNISSQKDNKTSSYYLIPKKGVFNDLIEEVEKLLDENNINLIKNSDFNIDNIKNVNKLEERYIWASSSLPLLKKYNFLNNINLTKNERYLGLLLFSMDSNKLSIWLNKFKYRPSEIIVLNEKFPYISRISFASNLESPQYNFFVVEVYCQNKELLSNLEIEKLTKYLSDIFKGQLKFIDLCLLSKVFNPTLLSFKKADDTLREIKENLPFEVPFTYWWPINTSHAVNAAKSFK